MKNIRRSRFSRRIKTSGDQKKTSWIKHNVRAAAVKDHPDLFGGELDQQVDSVKSKVRELEQKIAGTPRREAERRIRDRDILPMDHSEPTEPEELGMTFSERKELRNDRIRQTAGTLVLVVIALAFGIWALNYLLERL